ncbi:hypothetical protein VNO77_44570 [Canavalia gladiata]|uniref:Uncharacterized protein n=1 Tax=Canavalia gladiata TaxID=3824 RepID=A0AAN9PQI0_CANGL
MRLVAGSTLRSLVGFGYMQPSSNVTVEFWGCPLCATNFKAMFNALLFLFTISLTMLTVGFIRGQAAYIMEPHAEGRHGFRSSVPNGGKSSRRISCYNEVLCIDPLIANQLVNRGNIHKVLMESMKLFRIICSSIEHSTTAISEPFTNDRELQLNEAFDPRKLSLLTAVIKELTTLLNSSEVANCKRVAKSEGIIWRKNVTISKIKEGLGCSRIKGYAVKNQKASYMHA